MDTKQMRNVNVSGIQHLPTIDFIGNDFAILDDIRDVPLTLYSTCLDTACLTVCRKGRCRININLQEYEVREGMLCVILPEQIVQQGERSDDFFGSLTAVSRDFMDVVISTIQQLSLMFFMMKERLYIKVTAEELQISEEYHSFLWEKVRLKDNPYRGEIMQGLLLAPLCEIYDIYQGRTVEECTLKSHKEDLFGRFIRYVSEGYREERDVTCYADKIFLMFKYLSIVVKEINDKTTDERTDSLVILEAKASLRSSEQSIQEITDELYFTNQSFFGEYFKHHTDISPREYKEQQCERSLYDTGLNRWRSDAVCSGSLQNKVIWRKEELISPFPIIGK